MSLRTKTSLLLTVILLAALGVTSLLYLRYLEQSLRDSIYEGLASTVHSASELVAKFLSDSLKDAQVIGNILDHKAVADKDLDQVEARLKQLSEMFPNFENGLFILDPEGKLWVDYPQKSRFRGEAFAHREYFQRTLREQKGIVSEPYLSRRTGKPVVTFTSLLKDPAGQTLGVLGCSVQLTSTVALGGARLTRIGKTGYIYLYDTSRMMIFHPDEKRILQRDVPVGANRLFDAAIEGFEGSGETVNSRGVAMLLSMHRVPGINWIAVAQIPVAEAFAPLARAKAQILAILAAAILLSILVAGLAVRGMTQPLEKLHAAVRMMGSIASNGAAKDQPSKATVLNELDQIRAGGEIGVLVRTFTEIYGRLDETMASLRRAAQEWRRTIDTVPDAIFVLDRGDCIQRLNRAAAVSASKGFAELLRQPIQAVLETSEDPSAELADVAKLLPAGVTAARIRGREPALYLELSKSPLADDSGKAIGSVWVGKDITFRVTAEQEKKHWQERLQRAQKMEAMGTLAAGIAHDFNNILAAILGYTDVTLLELPKDSPLAANLEAILQAGDRAKELILQILAFSRQSLREPKPVKIGLLVDEALKLLRASLPATIEVNRRIASDALVMADATQIHQILMNLCANASHAMGARGGRLDIELDEVPPGSSPPAVQAEMAPGPVVRLLVRDTGHGMPRPVIDRIFDPFFTTKQQGEGTGLGLAVVHGIVRDHGGAITVESEVGRGSTFRIYLPAIRAASPSKRRPDVDLPRGQGRILLVDDEVSLTLVGRRLIEMLGYTVTTQTSGPEALELFRANPDAFDLVITDMTMPGMTGRELGEAILAIRPGIPVILCTGYSETVSAEAALALGFRAYLNKPISRHDLAQTLAGAMHPRVSNPGHPEPAALQPTMPSREPGPSPVPGIV